MNLPTVLSLQTGAAREIPATGTEAWWDAAWTSGFHKTAVTGPVWLGYGGLRGDQQADTRHHGGVDKAVCVYPSEHFAHWQRLDALRPLGPGGFGENVTTLGLLEADVCIGDIFRIGEARVQVSQPRQPCWKLARRWRVKDLTAQVEQTGRTGFYFRVLQHGWVEAGQSLHLEQRLYPDFSVACANEVMHHRKQDLAAARTWALCAALSASWKDALWLRAEGGSPPSPAARRGDHPASTA